MASKNTYDVIKLSGGWAVVMAANGHIVEFFPTETAAMGALREFECGRRVHPVKNDVWIVGDFVCEAGLGGMLLGEVDQLDMRAYNVVQELSQEEFDELMEGFQEEHGYYPDT
jgi:hypothetical protein